MALVFAMHKSLSVGLPQDLMVHLLLLKRRRGSMFNVDGKLKQVWWWCQGYGQTEPAPTSASCRMDDIWTGNTLFVVSLSCM
jgi:hypothetical protein